MATQTIHGSVFSFKAVWIAALLGVGISISFKSSPAVAQAASSDPPLPLNGNIVPLGETPSPNTAPASPANSASANQSSAAQFTFTNALEYGDCLEVILQLHAQTRALTQREQQSHCFATIQQVYGGESLSKSQALGLISTANFYATTLLARELYPLKGQRVRIAEQFGFIYKVDEDNPDIRTLAAQAQRE
jgi:flagellar basal body L-ring protein FlgH